MKELNKVQAIWQMKCPRCHKGDLFETDTFSFQKVFEMPDACDSCGQNYMPEPGFYYGAMFISYIFWGWFCVIFGVTTIMVLGLTVNQATLLLCFITAISFVWLFRFSRTLWIHIIVKRAQKKAKRLGKNNLV